VSPGGPSIPIFPTGAAQLPVGAGGCCLGAKPLRSGARRRAAGRGARGQAAARRRCEGVGGGEGGGFAGARDTAAGTHSACSGRRRRRHSEAAGARRPTRLTIPPHPRLPSRSWPHPSRPPDARHLASPLPRPANPPAEAPEDPLELTLRQLRRQERQLRDRNSMLVRDQAGRARARARARAGGWHSEGLPAAGAGTERGGGRAASAACRYAQPGRADGGLARMAAGRAGAAGGGGPSPAALARRRGETRALRAGTTGPHAPNRRMRPRRLRPLPSSLRRAASPSRGSLTCGSRRSGWRPSRHAKRRAPRRSPEAAARRSRGRRPSRWVAAAAATACMRSGNLFQGGVRCCACASRFEIVNRPCPVPRSLF
jgi:hypothetical protein